jgi:predicted MFS family arabinose efflux permease
VVRFPAKLLGMETRTRIVTRQLVLLLVADFGALTTLYLLLSVVPLYVTSIGVGGAGAGAATASLMLASMATELATPRLIARFGYRKVFGTGLVLLGAPALAFPLASSLPAVMAAGALCGLGFGIIVVTAGALVALMVPPERRGEGLGIYGVVVSLPGVIGLPLGVWLVAHAGYTPAFLLAGCTSLAGLVVLQGIPDLMPTDESPSGVVQGLREPALIRPALVFFATTAAGGIVAAFVPLAFHEVAAPALLAQTVTTTVTRYLAGRYADRRGAVTLLVPGLTVAALGILTLVLNPIVGMALFGAGFGVVQNASLAVMLERVSPAQYGTVNAVWSIAYDSGWGLGAAGFGVLAGATGYPTAFVTTGVLMLTALRPARRRA